MLRTLKRTSSVAIICAVTLCTQPAIAQSEKNEHVLDGTTIDWSYDANGARMVLSFEDGMAQYEWVAGRRAGNSAKDIPYRSREMSDGLFVLSWDQSARPDFITLIFDLNRNIMSSTGLIGYGTDNQRNLFQAGTVHSAKRQ
ncbi:hypothetical protein [uncultured Tateyamaria sp.]|uniref:hypothetical protein n=1 Tax=uncultured Tateyamaria sp. TaxID=455651 RepID=UPI002630AD9D|nr:hypothetical protein [uncultured Tateyamaria sp.]